MLWNATLGRNRSYLRQLCVRRHGVGRCSNTRNSFGGSATFARLGLTCSAEAYCSSPSPKAGGFSGSICVGFIARIAQKLRPHKNSAPTRTMLPQGYLHRLIRFIAAKIITACLFSLIHCTVRTVNKLIGGLRITWKQRHTNRS